MINNCFIYYFRNGFSEQQQVWRRWIRPVWCQRWILLQRPRPSRGERHFKVESSTVRHRQYSAVTNLTDVQLRFSRKIAGKVSFINWFSWRDLPNTIQVGDHCVSWASTLYRRSTKWLMKLTPWLTHTVITRITPFLFLFTSVVTENCRYMWLAAFTL